MLFCCCSTTAAAAASAAKNCLCADRHKKAKQEFVFGAFWFSLPLLLPSEQRGRGGQKEQKAKEAIYIVSVAASGAAKPLELDTTNRSSSGEKSEHKKREKD